MCLTLLSIFFCTSRTIYLYIKSVKTKPMLVSENVATVKSHLVFLFVCFLLLNLYFLCVVFKLKFNVVLKQGISKYIGYTL